MKEIRIIAIEGIPEIKPNDDVANILIKSLEEQGIKVEDNDIFVIAQKIVSKSEGRIVNLKDIKPSLKAIEISKLCNKDPEFVELVLKESEKVIKIAPGHLIVKNKQGIVCANAGIDKSNAEGEDVVILLPLDPDASAMKIRRRIQSLTGKKVGVIISDTYGRPLREGQINFAIGASGVSLFRDYRGKKDRYGYILHVKNIAQADEIASAAELLIGQADESIPAVIIRGLRVIDEDQPAKLLNMHEEKWLFK
jgi:F420-0:gamma-glutamyl ligase